MKKLLTWFLILVLCIPVFSCAHAQTDAKQRILSDWFDYLFVCENIHADMVWALDYADAYAAEPTWTRKQLASMVFTTAEKFISLRELPAATASMEDYALFAHPELDEDMSFMPITLEEFAATHADLITSIDLMTEYLDYSSFWLYGMDTMKQNSALVRKMMDLEFRYLAITTAYALAMLGEDEQNAHFRSMVEQHCPNISAAYPLTQSDIATLYSDAEAIAVELKPLEYTSAELDARWEAMGLMHDQSAESGDWSQFSDLFIPIAGLPLILPDPAWSAQYGSESAYYWIDGESISTPSERSQVTRVPDGYLLTCPGIGRDEVVGYCNLLSDCGLPSTGSLDEENLFIRRFSIDGCELHIEWNNGTAAIQMTGSLLCFAPIWYIEAMIG